MFPSLPIRLFVLVTLGIALGPSIAPAAQLDLSWVDHSDGQASFIIQRATSAAASNPQYTQIAQVPLGVTSYSDTTVSLDTAYCYRVAALEGVLLSPYSKIACAKPGGGFALVVTKAGAAGGTIASSPPGIACGTTCSFTYPAGKVVTLTASPSPGSTFIGWSRGGCTGTGPCIMVGNVSVIVTATFALLPGQALPTSTQGPNAETAVRAGFNKEGKK